MATQTTGTTDIATRLQTHFNPKLLDAMKLNLVLATYGLKEGYSINGLTIRFYRPRQASVAGVGAITQGVVPTTLATVPTGYKDITLGQRGELSEKITDVVLATDLLNIVKLYTDTFGEDGALDLDSVIRDCLIAGLLNSDATYDATHGFERFAGVTNGADSSTDFATFQALSAANAKFTRERHLTMVTQLKDAKVKTIGGLYAAIVPPATMHDIRLDTTWLTAAQQNDNQALYKRGTIILDGAVFVENDNPFREAATYGTYDAAGANRSNIYLGKDAFGVPNLNDKRAGSAPMKPKIEIVGLTADSGNPLKQWIQVGWKSFYGAAPFITNLTGEVPRYGILRTKSTFN